MKRKIFFIGFLILIIGCSSKSTISTKPKPPTRSHDDFNPSKRLDDFKYFRGNYSKKELSIPKSWFPITLQKQQKDIRQVCVS